MKEADGRPYSDKCYECGGNMILIKKDLVKTGDKIRNRNTYQCDSCRIERGFIEYV